MGYLIRAVQQLEEALSENEALSRFLSKTNKTTKSKTKKSKTNKSNKKKSNKKKL